ncbi:hypothetical protein BDN67DRAFT_966906 [Paxillus ammoniavirescens]|nr:hypothetical protein BDN67DRAFT_966906 [Paxillus ammoniavirescens]
MIVLCAVILASRAISTTPLKTQAIAILDLAILICTLCQRATELLISSIGLFHDYSEAVFASLHSLDNFIFRWCFRPLSVDGHAREPPLAPTLVVPSKDPHAMARAANPPDNDSDSETPIATPGPRKMYKPREPHRVNHDDVEQQLTTPRRELEPISSSQMLDIFKKRQTIEEAIAWIEKCDRVLSSGSALLRLGAEQVWVLRAMRAEQAGVLARFVLDEDINRVYRATEGFDKSPMMMMMMMMSGNVHGSSPVSRIARLCSETISPRKAAVSHRSPLRRSTTNLDLADLTLHIIAQLENKERLAGCR